MSAPLYIQIKQFILDKIDAGEWIVGHRIATEIELTEQFGVSRNPQPGCTDDRLYRSEPPEPLSAQDIQPDRVTNPRLNSQL